MSMPPTKGETRGSWRMQPPGTLPGISNQLAPRDVSKPGLQIAIRQIAIHFVHFRICQSVKSILSQSVKSVHFRICDCEGLVNQTPDFVMEVRDKFMQISPNQRSSVSKVLPLDMDFQSLSLSKALPHGFSIFEDTLWRGNSSK